MNPPTREPGFRRMWSWELSAVAVALVGVAVRMIPWPYVFSGGTMVPPGTDPYYHLWRAQKMVENFPFFPVFDPYISFPAGAHIPWPPGFDFLVALPGFLGAGPATLAGWGAVLMPLLGGVSVYLVYRLGKAVFDPPTGFLAAVFLALMSGAVGFSFVGRVDHHGMVAAVVLGMYLALLAALRAERPNRAIAWAVACGLIAAIAVGSWIITPPLYFLPVPVSLVLLHKRFPKDRLLRVAWAGLLSSLLFVVLVVVATADLKALPFTLYQPSWFTVLLIALAALGAIPLLLGWRVFLAVWGGMAGLGIAMLIFAPEVFEPLREAVGIASGQDVSYLIAKESSKLYMEGEFFVLSQAASRYTHLLLLSPVLVVIYGLRETRKKERCPGRVLAGVYVCLGLVLLVLQERFGEYAAPALSLLFAWALVAGARRFASFYRTAASRIRARVWAFSLVAVLILALSPLVTGLVRLAGADQTAFRRQFLFFARGLADTLPPLETRDELPSYGLLTSWNETHPLLYATGRPVVTSSFATAEALAGNKKGFSILLSLEEGDAYPVLVDERIRFVVVAPIISQVKAMASMAGMPHRYMDVRTDAGPDGYIRHFQPLRPFADCLHTRMLVSDGSVRMVSGNRQKPLAHFRLYMESRSTTLLFDQRIPQFKAFEVVAGARLEGQAEPGQAVGLRLAVQTNTGRRFSYRRETTAGEDGRYHFVVPYPTGKSSAPTLAPEPYRIKVGDIVNRVEVGEDLVRGGGVVTVP